MNTKHYLVKLFLGSLLIGVTTDALARVYYMAPNGNDKSNGSKGSPWKSIDRA